MEDIDYRAARGLDKSVIRALTQESVWVVQHENIFVLGPTGVGKSYLASALAQKAPGLYSTERGKELRPFPRAPFPLVAFFLRFPADYLSNPSCLPT